MPLELAVVAPFHPISAFKLTADQTAEMIKVAARPPFERRDAINGWRRTLGYESLDKISAWGLDISPNMVSLTGEWSTSVGEIEMINRRGIVDSSSPQPPASAIPGTRFDWASQAERRVRIRDASLRSPPPPQLMMFPFSTWNLRGKKASVPVDNGAGQS